MGDNLMYCNQLHIITYIPSPLLYSIKSHSQALLMLKVREFHKNMNTRRQESWGPPLKLSTTIDTVKFLGIRVLGFLKQFLLECVFLSGDKNSDSQKYPWNLGIMNKHLLILPIDISECKRLAKFGGTPPFWSLMAQREKLERIPGSSMEGNKTLAKKEEFQGLPGSHLRKQC